MAGRGSGVVTGGAGFIGCAVSSALAVRFERVVAVDMLHPQVHPGQERPSALAREVELWRLDVAEPATWNRVFDDLTPSVIIHLAAETGTAQSMTEAARYVRANVNGLAVMLDALSARELTTERIVLASSRAVYGNGAWQPGDGSAIIYPGPRRREQLARAEWDFPDCHYLPAEAVTTRAEPISVYGATKLAQEHLLGSWSAASGTIPVIVRFQNVYGPGQSLHNPYTGIIPLFCRLADRGEPIPLYEDGGMLRDFVFIDDAAAALIDALDVPGRRPHIYDIGSGVARTIAEVAQFVAGLYNAPAPHVCGRYRYGDVRHAACDIEATRQALGWSPRHGLGAGLALVKDWVQDQLARAQR
jgi:dTDP-L-rhamnose 4-epimerase